MWFCSKFHNLLVEFSQIFLHISIENFSALVFMHTKHQSIDFSIVWSSISKPVTVCLLFYFHYRDRKYYFFRITKIGFFSSKKSKNECVTLESFLLSHSILFHYLLCDTKIDLLVKDVVSFFTFFSRSHSVNLTHSHTHTLIQIDR